MTAIRFSVINDPRFWEIEDEEKRFGMMLTFEALIRIGEETDPEHTGDGCFPKPGEGELKAKCDEVFAELQQEAAIMLPKIRPGWLN